MIQPLAVKFDKFANNAKLAQHFNNAQHKVGRRCALLHFACNLKAYDLGDQHRNRLAEHGGLGLNAADTPAQNGQTVDHSRVGIRTHQRVGISHGFTLVLFILIGPDRLGQIFQIDLVTDTRSGRYDAEIAERPLPPFQKLVTLSVTLELLFHIRLKGSWGTKFIHHHRVVNHKVNGHQRVNFLRIAV